MTRKQAVMIAAAITGGLAVGLAFLAGVLMLTSGGGLIGCTAATAAGWTIPLVAGLVIGGVAWILLGSDASSGRNGPSVTNRCSDCGRPVAREWRLCPHCGTRTRTEEASQLLSSTEKSTTS